MYAQFTMSIEVAEAKLQSKMFKRIKEKNKHVVKKMFEIKGK